MIRDNDRILLPLSEDPNSIALLHILHQYQCYMSTKGLNFTFGVTLMDFKNGDRQLQVLESYIKYLGVDCVQNEIDSKHSGLCAFLGEEEKVFKKNLLRRLENYSLTLQGH